MQIDRDMVKENANQALKTNQGTYIGAFIVVMIIIGTASSVISTVYNSIVRGIVGTDFQRYVENLSYEINNGYFDDDEIAVLLGVLALYFIVILINTIVGYFFRFGVAYLSYKFYVSTKPEFTDVFKQFSKIGGSILLALLMTIFTLLWSMLFYIPGIIAAYSYIYAPIIYLTEDVSPMQAIKKSKEITKGHKFDIFIMQLSYIGWLLLGVLTCHILNIVYVIPWMNIAVYGYYAELSFDPNKNVKSGLDNQTYVNSDYSTAIGYGQSNPYSANGNPYGQESNPYSTNGNPYGQDSNPYATSGNPYGQESNPYSTNGNPYGQESNPYSTNGNPYGQDSNPYATSGNPYGQDSNPYATSGNPYGQDSNPYATSGNPYGQDSNPYNANENPYSTNENPYFQNGQDNNPYGGNN